MRVVSSLADIDFHVGAIAHLKACIVVQSRSGEGIPTTVYVDRDDVVGGMKALLRSPAALWFVLTAPLRRSRPAGAAVIARTGTNSNDVNNPW